MEDKRLHNAPQPWKSSSKRSGIAGILFFLFGIIPFYLIYTRGNTPGALLILFIFGGIGVFVLYTSLFDHKDKWYMEEIYRQNHIAAIGKAFGEYLMHTKTPHYGGQEHNRSFFTRAPTYQFSVDTKPFMIVRIEKVYKKNRNTNTSTPYTHVSIQNIVQQNLEEAKVLADVLRNIVEMTRQPRGTPIIDAIRELFSGKGWG